MNIIQKAQHRFTESQSDKSFDPATIAVIATLIIQVVQLWRNCHKTPVEVVEASKNPTRLQKFKLRRMARQELGNSYNEYGDSVVNAILEAGKEVTEEDIEGVSNEII
jgi:hypothetical protein